MSLMFFVVTSSDLMNFPGLSDTPGPLKFENLLIVPISIANMQPRSNTVCTYSLIGCIHMPRNGDIKVSFHEAMRRSAKYGVTVSTADFVAELAKRNWEMSHRQANEWIAQNVMTFRDQSPDDGENKLWQRFYHYGEY